MMHVHMIGVCGTGMGALAGLLRAKGYRVTGSDTAFYPPMGPALKAWGVEVRQGWDPANLMPRPDMVVVGNVCRRDNPEARAAIDAGVPYCAMPTMVANEFLADADARRSFVVAGTHGKTTTTSLLAHMLHSAGQNPGFLIGGIPQNFDASFCLGGAEAPFVLEGDEYDSAFFEKTPKCWHYRPYCVVLTSIEHDHMDIYPDKASYLDAFVGLVQRIPKEGLLVAYAGDALVRQVAQQAVCRVRYYALDSDDCGEVSPTWLAALGKPQGETLPFDLFGGGSFCGRVYSPLFGAHNIRNILAALAIASEGTNTNTNTNTEAKTGTDLSALMRAVSQFGGVKRRQELLGIVDGVYVYDDFAHHPTAVSETLQGLRARHPEGALFAVFEPRSATASRKLHQQEYTQAFSAADYTFLAPVGRKEIADEDKLDVNAICDAMRTQQKHAEAPPSLEALREALVQASQPGDTILLMSNGAFGGIYDKLLADLATRKTCMLAPTLASTLASV